MSVAGATPVLSAMNGFVCCPTCGHPAIVEGSFLVQGAGGPVGRLRISCVDGHGWLLLADRVRQVEPWEGFGDQSDRNATIPAPRSEQVTLGATGSASGGAALPVDHRKAGQAE